MREMPDFVPLQIRGRKNRRCQVIKNARVKYKEPTVDAALAVLGFSL